MPHTGDPRNREVASAALIALVVWGLLLLGALLEPVVGAEQATFASFLAAACLAVATRPRAATARPARWAAHALAGVWAGWASHPAWLALIGVSGLLLGLAPAPRPLPHSEPLILVSTLVLAPFFEELVYRGRLLPALARRAGWPVAIAVTSGLFALPHLHAWSVLGTFLVGIGLGLARRYGGSIAFCVGTHSGLNLAATFSHTSVSV